MQKAHYMLRRTLLPWRFEETTIEMEHYCSENKVAEVIWKVDVEEFSHGLPTLELIQSYIPLLKEAKKRLEVIGVKSSINPWVTLNHADRGRDGSFIFPDIQWMVDYTGVSARFCACPLSPTWQRYIVRAYELYASVEPEILWLEDDFRNFNHQPVRFGCFCPLHLSAFSKKVGRKVSREEIVQNILLSGKPHPDRTVWFDLIGNTMVEVAQIIEKATHSVSPLTRLGLMTSHPWHHSIEGRDWHKLLKALSGPYEPIVRPTMGNYSETSYEGIYYAADTLRRTVFCLPQKSRICPELENSPFTQFSKSVRFTRLQIALSQVLKARDITMNLYDHLGTPIATDDPYRKMLRESKSFFDALASYYLQDGKECGVGLLHHPRASDYVHIEAGKDFEELIPYDDGWSVVIQACGMPITFESSNVVAVTGQVLRAFNKERILSLLSKGVLLDLSATESLIEEGYGEYLGVAIKRRLVKTDIPLSAEKIIDEHFSRFSEVYLRLTNLTSSQKMAELSLVKGSKVISVFVDPDRREIMPGMVLFENTLGGRIAIYPFDLQYGTKRTFLNWHRKVQIEAVIRWLWRGAIPLFVEGGAHMLPLRTDYKDYTLISIVNLSSDRWDHITISVSKREYPFGGIKMVLESGNWIEAPVEERIEKDEFLKIKFNAPLEPLELGTFLVYLNSYPEFPILSRAGMNGCPRRRNFEPVLEI